MSQSATEERIEAVIISGPRKGAVVELVNDVWQLDFGPHEEALFDLEMKVAKAEAELQIAKDIAKRTQETVRQLKSSLNDLSGRVTQLEVQRESQQREVAAQLSQFQAEVAQFKTEVERAELRLSRQLPASQPIDEDNK